MPVDVPAWSTVSGMPLLIIDAGHGGEDGGAVSLTGEYESRINLSIAKRLDMVLGLFGAPVLMLRQEDISLHDRDAGTLREKKVSDLHNRVAKVQEQENAVLLSIHQNSYPDGRYSGAQVFYAPTAGSDALAQAMQDTLRAAVAPENQRQAKPIPDTIYLMSHISCPAILVECGFLTNVGEEQLLRDGGYQTVLAAAMAGCWLAFSG
ncbi:MAG: N-acetylmuramoyl-L-alanine amidase [Oscillospiraceae bacterium]|nr:N-acetylmuramoyl-L-alanine amidase [Oscillospiraceae bacterium]